jgi:hypothetical protein
VGWDIQVPGNEYDPGNSFIGYASSAAWGASTMLGFTVDIGLYYSSGNSRVDFAFIENDGVYLYGYWSLVSPESAPPASAPPASAPDAARTRWLLASVVAGLFGARGLKRLRGFSIIGWRSRQETHPASQD